MRKALKASASTSCYAHLWLLPHDAGAPGGSPDRFSHTAACAPSISSWRSQPHRTSSRGALEAESALAVRQVSSEALPTGSPQKQPSDAGAAQPASLLPTVASR